MAGLVFFLLGYLRLGAFIEFFPRVVLVGCIGGVGAFLVLTGVQVCAGLENETLHFTWDVIQRFFEIHMLLLWVRLMLPPSSLCDLKLIQCMCETRRFPLF